MNREELTIFRRRKVGFIFQSYNLVQDLNVYENIVLPIRLDGKRVDRDFVEEIMQLLQINDKKQALPGTLSGGQQQRVAIARALAAKPRKLLPFAADTGLHAVMVGHIAAPNVTGDDTPATLSPQLVALIPDAENTLIVTDSLAMDAITAAYTPGEAAVQALQAGCDVLLMPNSLPEAYAAVLEAVQNGTISEERLDRSVNKILLYKQQFAS